MACPVVDGAKPWPLQQCCAETFADLPWSAGVSKGEQPGGGEKLAELAEKGKKKEAAEAEATELNRASYSAQPNGDNMNRATIILCAALLASPITSPVSFAYADELSDAYNNTAGDAEDAEIDAEIAAEARANRVQHCISHRLPNGAVEQTCHSTPATTYAPQRYVAPQPQHNTQCPFHVLFGLPCLD
jgi:hypothetical protein